MEKEKEFYTVEELSKTLGLCLSSCYRLVRNKSFPSRKILGRYLTSKKDLLVWFENQAK